MLSKGPPLGADSASGQTFPAVQGSVADLNRLFYPLAKWMETGCKEHRGWETHSFKHSPPPEALGAPRDFYSLPAWVVGRVPPGQLLSARTPIHT